MMARAKPAGVGYLAASAFPPQVLVVLDGRRLPAVKSRIIKERRGDFAFH